MKKQISVLIFLALIIVLLSACDRTEKTEPTAALIESEATQQDVAQAEQTETVTEPPRTEYEQPKEEPSLSLVMTIGDTPISVEWEDSDAVEALRELCREKPLTIEMSMYGGFEQVGAVGTALPTDDRQTTTSPGDIVLYSGDQLVVFYGSNSWAYTPLGHITDQTTEELTQLLSNGNVTITLSC